MIFLVGLDGSRTSKAAFELACTYAKAIQADLEIVTSMEEGNTDDVSEIIASEDQLKWAESFAKDNGVKANSHLLIRGMNSGEDLVEFAKECAAEAIFIGIKKRSKVGKMIFGSNAQHIILNAPCPVMTVK